MWLRSFMIWSDLISNSQSYSWIIAWMAILAGDNTETVGVKQKKHFEKTEIKMCKNTIKTRREKEKKFAKTKIKQLCVTLTGYRNRVTFAISVCISYYYELLTERLLTVCWSTVWTSSVLESRTNRRSKKKQQQHLCFVMVYLFI